MKLLFNKCLTVFLCFLLLSGQLAVAGVYEHVDTVECHTLSPDSSLKKAQGNFSRLVEDKQLRALAKTSTQKGALAKLLLRFRNKKAAQDVINSKSPKTFLKNLYQRLNNRFVTFAYLQIPFSLMAIFPGKVSAQEAFTPKEFLPPTEIVTGVVVKDASSLKAADYTKSAEAASIDVLSDELLGESTAVRGKKTASFSAKSVTATKSSIYSFPDAIPADLVLEVDTAARRSWIKDNLLPVFETATNNFATMSDNDKREFFKELVLLLGNPDFKTLLGSYPSWDDYLGQDLIDTLYHYSRDLTKAGMEAGQSKLINGWAVMARLQGLKGFFKVKPELVGYDDDFKNNVEFKTALDNEIDYYPQQTDRDLREYMALSIAYGGQYNDYKVISSELYRSFDKKEAVVADVSALLRDLGHRNMHLPKDMHNTLDNIISITNAIFQHTDDSAVRSENIYHIATLMKALRDYNPVRPDTGTYLQVIKDLKIDAGMRFVESFIYGRDVSLTAAEKAELASHLELTQKQKELFLDYDLLAFAFNKEIDGVDGNRRFREHEFDYMTQLQSFLWETEHLFSGIRGVVGNSRYILTNEEGRTFAYVGAGLRPFMGMPVGNNNISFEVLFHEAGHIAHGMLDPHGDLREHFRKVFVRSDDRNDFITNYAQTSTTEDLAEMFRFWMVDSRALIKEAFKRKSEGSPALLEKVLLIADLFTVQNDTDKVYFLTSNEDEMKYEAIEIERDENGYIVEESILNHIPSVEEIDLESKGFFVDHPYPSPFGQTTTIPVSTSGRSRIIIEVYNSIGQKVEEVFNEEIFEGKQNISWTPKAIADGIYFIRVTEQKSGKLAASYTKKVLYQKGLHRFSLKGLFAPLAVFLAVPASLAAIFVSWQSGIPFENLFETIVTTLTSYPAAVTAGMFLMSITSALRIPLSKKTVTADAGQLAAESVWLETNDVDADDFYRLSGRIRDDLLVGHLRVSDDFDRFSVAMGTNVNVKTLSMLPKFFQNIVIYIHEPIPSHFKGIIAMIPGLSFLVKKPAQDMERYFTGLDVYETELAKDLWAKGIATEKNWHKIKRLLTVKASDTAELLDAAAALLALAYKQSALMDTLTFKKLLASKMLKLQQRQVPNHDTMDNYANVSLVNQSV